MKVESPLCKVVNKPPPPHEETISVAITFTSAIPYIFPRKIRINGPKFPRFILHL